MKAPPPEPGPTGDVSPGAPRTAKAGVRDLLRLAARITTAFVRRRAGFDPAALVSGWARDVMARDHASELRVDVAGRGFELIGGPAQSERVLAAHPASGGYAVGAAKKNAMSFLAPGALTIAEGDDWTRLRAFNEQVLAPGATHPYAQDFVRSVRDAFSRRVSDREDVLAAMGRAMVAIVLGPGVPAGADPAGDVRALFDVVQSPLKRKLLGFRYRERRARLYALLAQRWAAATAGTPSLLALARSVAPDATREELLQQIPHWMFTFTGSGTDLLTRALALISARPEAHRSARAEIASAGPPDRAETVEQLAFVHACVLEAGRLFPPVTRTFHRPRASSDPTTHDTSVGHAAGGNRDVVHFFPLLQRDDRLGADVHEFRPERWLEPELDAAAAASNLFLRGPRACPGADLILFVCTAAIARQVGELDLGVRASRLSRDPLPVSFPEREARFSRAEASS